MSFLLFMGVNKQVRCILFTANGMTCMQIDATDCNGVDSQHTW